MLCHVFSALTLLAGRHEEQQMPLHPQIPSTLASFKPSLVLPFWYQLTQVVLGKRPLIVGMGQFGASVLARPFWRRHVLAQRQTYTVFFKLMVIIMYLRFNEVNVIRLSTDMS